MRNVTTTAINWAMLNGLLLKSSPMSAKHAPFVLTPTPLDGAKFELMRQASVAFGKLIDAVSKDEGYLRALIGPLVESDPFFSALLEMHTAIHKDGTPRRLPLLIMRTDYMDDAALGPKVVEFNSIAAGMGPFGEKVHQLHHYLGQNSLIENSQPLLENKATFGIASAIAEAAKQIKCEFNDEGSARVIFVVQSDEDNIFDQALLANQIADLGAEVIRKTFSELSEQLTTGDDSRLLLEGKPVDAVYLRAGYQYSDYVATHVEEIECCRMIKDTRVFIEKHRVAVNATVSQQLATSKKVQMALTNEDASHLSRFGLSASEIELINLVLAPMQELSPEHEELQNFSEWVLKNQGEGGGHCIFDEDIPRKIQDLDRSEYPSWSLMYRIRPQARLGSANVVRNGENEQIEQLISEFGLFTTHIDGEAVQSGYAGYLVRSKSIETKEGGVHSGSGVLDSIALST